MTNHAISAPAPASPSVFTSHESSIIKQALNLIERRSFSPTPAPITDLPFITDIKRADRTGLFPKPMTTNIEQLLYQASTQVDHYALSEAYAQRFACMRDARNERENGDE